MYNAKLEAVITDVKTKQIKQRLQVMELRYKVKDNVMWITTHNGSLLDYDLNKWDVKIVMKGEN